jgi:hypothetical protein
VIHLSLRAAVCSLPRKVQRTFSSYFPTHHPINQNKRTDDEFRVSDGINSLREGPPTRRELASDARFPSSIEKRFALPPTICSI